MELLATQQPTATDLRFLMAFMHIVTALERMADLVTNICERVMFVATGRMEELNVSSYHG